jgi:hypothetical protein
LAGSNFVQNYFENSGGGILLYSMKKHNKEIWNSLDSIVKFLKSIAVDGKVPGNNEMRRIYGRPFRYGVLPYGGYKNVVKAAGLKIRKHHRASDGHILVSFYEYLFDEYLYLNGIQHEIDGRICSDSCCRYDFKLNDVYVEIWGVSTTGESHYNNYLDRRKKKEKLYSDHGLNLISLEGKDFGKSSNDLQTLFKIKLAEFGIHSNDTQIKYPVFNTRKIDYWNDDTVIEELKQYIKNNNKFPVSNDLLGIRNDLGGAIVKYGGYRKFARILGYASQTLEYSEERIIKKLTELTQSLGHFPCDRELQEMKRSDLAASIKRHGGYGHFKEKITGSRDRYPFGYWNNEENIIKELRVLVQKLGHFPKYSELEHIAKGIDKSKKGMRYFQDKLCL